MRCRFLVKGDDATNWRLFIQYLYLFFWAIKIRIFKQYDVIVFFTSAIGNGFFGALFSLLGIKVVLVILAEEIPLARRAQGLRGMLKRLCIRGYTRADGFISNCQFASDTLVDMGVDLNRICLIPSPLALSKLQFGPANGRGRRGHDILTVTRLVKRKGVHLLIDAVDLLRAQISDIHLTVVGDGDEMGTLKEQVQSRSLEEFVTFVGAVSDDQKISQFYNSCDLFVLANIMLSDGNCEGTPNVLVEANAHGKPVIAGIDGGTASAVTNGVNGYLVNPRDVPQMAERIKQILLDPDLAARLGSVGRKKVSEEHDPVKAGNQFSAFLQKLIRAGDNGP